MNSARAVFSLRARLCCGGFRVDVCSYDKNDGTLQQAQRCPRPDGPRVRTPTISYYYDLPANIWWVWGRRFCWPIFFFVRSVSTSLVIACPGGRVDTGARRHPAFPEVGGGETRSIPGIILLYIGGGSEPCPCLAGLLLFRPFLISGVGGGVYPDRVDSRHAMII